VLALVVMVQILRLHGLPQLLLEGGLLTEILATSLVEVEGAPTVVRWQPVALVEGVMATLAEQIATTILPVPQTPEAVAARLTVHQQHPQEPQVVLGL
jgi:hypothetical protein